jgi:uncharacterized protein (TIGR04255 family)
VSYNRPIIVEIYADLFLRAGTLPFARFFDLVPQLQLRGFAALESTDNALLDMNVADRSVGASRVRRVRCWSADRTKLIQLAPDNVTMNLVSPDGSYPGWQAFIGQVFTPTIEALRISLPAWRAESIALNAIDRVAIPRESFRLGDYLNCGGPRIPAVLADTRTAFDYDIGRGLLPIDARNRQLHINGQVTTDAYLIQMQAVLHDMVETSDLGTILDRLHKESVEWFESLITDRMRHEIMKGWTNASSRL